MALFKKRDIQPLQLCGPNSQPIPATLTSTVIVIKERCATEHASKERRATEHAPKKQRVAKASEAIAVRRKVEDVYPSLAPRAAEPPPLTRAIRYRSPLRAQAGNPRPA